jgi:hypothetical protein
VQRFPKLIMRRSFACRTLLALIFIAIAVTILTSAASGESVSYRYTGQIHFDVKRVPFSRFGSYLSISDLSDFQPPLRRSGLYLRTMHEGGKNAFQLQLTRAGVTIPFTVSATPTLLTLSADSAFVEISFQGPDRLRIRGHGAALQLTADAAWLVPYQHGNWEINTSAMKYMLLPIDGDVHTSSTTSGDGAGTNVLTTDGRPIRSQSLLLDLPIILGTRLPASVQAKLIADLRKRASESSFGLASEPEKSPLYAADGYWRGPIWAPSTMIITAELDEMGEHTLADSLKERFCRMAQKSGMAENFDAQTGDALRDPAYTWTSSVFLQFAPELAEPRAASQRISTSIPARKRESTVR